MTALAEEAPGSADVRVVEPARRIRGTIRVPGDKSISHRAALFNSLAAGSATITHYASGADCASTLGCAAQLGAEVHKDGSTVTIRGVGLRGLQEPRDLLDCGNSGTTMRLLAGTLAGAGLYAVLSGDSSLRRRPMARVAEPLRAMGARIHGRDGDRLPPLTVLPVARLQGIAHRLPVASAQVKSAILLAGLFADGETVVESPAISRDHTERMLAAMGAIVRSEGRVASIRAPGQLEARDVSVPGDFSSAAFWLVLACIHPDAEVRVLDVGVNPARTGLLTIFEAMGADVRLENQRDVAGEPVADVVARSSALRGTHVSGDLVPLAIDELPLVALMASFASSPTEVRDASELRVKESDRITAVADGLRALSGTVEAHDDGWTIQPSRLERGAADSLGDHRLAMLFALAGVASRGSEVHSARSVAVSYPSFWDQLAELASA